MFNIKKTTLIAALISSSIVIWGCTEDGLEPSPYEEVNTLDNVSIEFEKNVYAPEGDTFILHTYNRSDDEISYGIAFTVETEEEGEWFIVEPEEEMSFILIAHILEPGEEAQEEVNMEYYEPFDAGTYRLVREIEGEVLTAEFEVN